MWRPPQAVIEHQRALWFLEGSNTTQWQLRQAFSRLHVEVRVASTTAVTMRPTNTSTAVPTGPSATESDVRAVVGPDRVRELARMLSGQEDSEAARTHAAELLELSGVGR